ncbi:Rho-binding antiterminator [Corallincola platygyrae]|uniref:Rho-binding antiterminator n=1 Tax=Corallincola platygyrae TaxID=1193278 RepID=A0ABW4XPX6_9GAMM
MITCAQYDYIEIACMYRYPVELTLKSGEVLSGVAIDTQRNSAKQECILVEQKQGKHLVVLDELVAMEVTVENPHFKRVIFD